MKRVIVLGITGTILSACFIFLLMLIVVFFGSCTEGNHAKVQYLTGKVEYVGNATHIGESGDSVIVQHMVYMSDSNGMYSTDKIWGYYVGIVPNEIISYKADSSRRSRTWYEIAIKQ